MHINELIGSWKTTTTTTTNNNWLKKSSIASVLKQYRHVYGHFSGLNPPLPENSVQDSPDLNWVWKHMLFIHNFPASNYKPPSNYKSYDLIIYMNTFDLLKLVYFMIIVNMLNVHWID